MGMSGREWVRHGGRGAAAKICGVAASLSRWLAVPCIRNPRDIRPPRPGFDVGRTAAYVEVMSLVQWAESTAREYLERALPRR